MAVPVFAVTVAAALAPNGCTTTAVTGDGGTPSGSSSSSSGSTASSSSSGSGSGGSSSSSSSGGGPLDAAPDGPITQGPCSAKVPAPDAGTSFSVDNFSTVSAVDSGVAYNNGFGLYPGYFGGTYFFPYGPPTITAPGQGGTDVNPNADAGLFCSTPWSQNTFTATVTPTSSSWVLAGNVAGFSGAGIYIQSAPNLCVDASAYTGISFTISGTLGAAATVPADAGNASDAGDEGGADATAAAPPQLSLKVFEGMDLQYTSATVGAAGVCLTNCLAPSFNFAVPSTPTTMTVHWADFTGGTPDPSVGDPAHLTGIEWDLPWPCTGGVPYPVNITIQDVRFITQ